MKQNNISVVTTRDLLLSKVRKTVQKEKTKFGLSGTFMSIDRLAGWIEITVPKKDEAITQFIYSLFPRMIVDGTPIRIHEMSSCENCQKTTKKTNSKKSA